MIHFFRDILDGPVYIITTILAIIFIMAIIGYIMEKKKIAKELKEKTAVVDAEQVTPIDEVKVDANVTLDELVNQHIINNNQVEEENSGITTSPVYVFEDPDQKGK